MAEGRALGKPGRARGVLDVDRIVGREGGLDLGHLFAGDPASAAPISSSQSEVPMKITCSRLGISSRTSSIMAR